MEDEGYRPLSGDSDYIYKIEGKGTWYGWPDYSGEILLILQDLEKKENL